MMQGWYYVESLTGQRHDSISLASLITILSIFGWSDLLQILRKQAAFSFAVLIIMFFEEKDLSPRQESKPWPPQHWAGALSTELWELMESKVILLSSYVTVAIIKWIKMVNFELGN